MCQKLVFERNWFFSVLDIWKNIGCSWMLGFVTVWQLIGPSSSTYANAYVN